MPRRKSIEDLGNIRQGSNESLKEYLTCFDKESILVENLNQEVATSLLMNGLQVSGFYQHIKRKHIVDLAHFRRKADEWIVMEEAYTSKLGSVSQPSNLSRKQGVESKGADRPPLPRKKNFRYKRPAIFQDCFDYSRFIAIP